jgi:hypothetical protein
MFDKNVLGYLSLVVSVIGYAPYIAAIVKRQCRPHAFSWITWTLTGSLAYAAQGSRDAGPGAWVTGFAVVACAAISWLALRYGERRITRIDKILFSLSLAAIPLWVLTKDPLWSVVLLVAISYLGFLPTFRKTYYYPYDEIAFFYVSVIVKFLLGIAALDQYSLVTVLCPLNSVIINSVFLAMMFWRRRKNVAIVRERWAVPVTLEGAL